MSKVDGLWRRDGGLSAKRAVEKLLLKQADQAVVMVSTALGRSL